jgi:aminomethyltransferase
MTQKTPLYDAHLAINARMVPFAGWEMPIQYPTGILAEHHAVRTGAGLFDVSHMGEIEFRGPGALDEANRLLTNDLSRISDGQALYAGLDPRRALARGRDVVGERSLDSPNGLH